MHARWQHQIPSMYMLRVGGRVSRNLMLGSNLLKSKIPMLRVGGWVGGGGLQNLMLSSNLLKSKIPMLRVGGGGFHGI